MSNTEYRILKEGILSIFLNKKKQSGSDFIPSKFFCWIFCGSSVRCLTLNPEL